MGIFKHSQPFYIVLLHKHKIGILILEMSLNQKHRKQHNHSTTIYAKWSKICPSDFQFFIGLFQHTRTHVLLELLCCDQNWPGHFVGLLHSNLYPPPPPPAAWLTFLKRSRSRTAFSCIPPLPPLPGSPS